jgi:predicted RNase H-like nuclease (RuvC/YqgF family)
MAVIKDAQFNVQELNKSLAAQDDLVQELTDNISDFERELDKMNTKDTNRIKNTKELIKVTKKQLAEEKSGIKQIKTERIEANKVLKDATKNEADFGGVLGFIDGKLGGAISGMKAFTKTTGSIDNVNYRGLYKK